MAQVMARAQALAQAQAQAQEALAKASASGSGNGSAGTCGSSAASATASATAGGAASATSGIAISAGGASDGVARGPLGVPQRGPRGPSITTSLSRTPYHHHHHHVAFPSALTVRPVAACRLAPPSSLPSLLATGMPIDAIGPDHLPVAAAFEPTAGLVDATRAPHGLLDALAPGTAPSGVLRGRALADALHEISRGAATRPRCARGRRPRR